MDVAVAGSYAYVAWSTNGGLRIINISNPAAPTEVGFYNTPGPARGVAVVGSYAYVLTGDCKFGSSTPLRIIDVSNPAAPTEVSLFGTPGCGVGLAVAGSYAYVTNGSSGLRIINVSNPAAPTEIGFYDTIGTAVGVAVAGGYAYVADGSGGLVILQYIQPPTINANGLSPNSAAIGGGQFTLTVTGTNFINGSVVRWNGSNRPTTFVNANQLTATITAADVAASGTYAVTVFNPPPGGGTSNAVNFFVCGSNFRQQTNVPLNTWIISNPIYCGCLIPQSIWIVGGEYSIDGGAFTSNPGTIYPGQTVRVRITSPGTHGTTAQATLYIGGTSYIFWITTFSGKIYLPIILKEYSYIPGSGVPRTGQTASYGTRDDGALQKGVVWPNPRFTDNYNGTVTDNLTGLIWLKNADCFLDITWEGALSESNALADGKCGLFDGSTAGQWRLPNVKELHSLIDFAFYAPALSDTAGTGQWQPNDPFTGVQSGAYWSSSTPAGNSPHAWGVSLFNGTLPSGEKAPGSTAYVWPVRGGQDVVWPNPRFTDNHNGTVTDNLTGLIWLKNANCFGNITWPGALNESNTLAGGKCGLSDGSTAGQWRLPNVRELQSLIDFAYYDPALSNTAGTGQWQPNDPFTGVQSCNDGSCSYWASSTPAGNTPHAWGVNLYNGTLPERR